MDAFLQLGKRNRAFIVEDCAHALEAEFRGVPCGTMGEFGCFSFYATKNITTGEGGMLTCAEERFREAAEVWHLHGMSRAAWERHNDNEFRLYDITEPGFKFNMTDLQASLGLAQLPRAEAWLKRRGEIVAVYDAAFAGIPGIRTLKRRAHVRSALHLYAIILEPGALSISRDRFITAMRAENIQCYAHFPALHLTCLYRRVLGHKPGDFPVAEAAAAGLVTLPLFPAMTGEDVQDVITAVTKLVDYYRA
jgi:dTDP-4-amino-4,6-dideoxygalactose transaminase